VDVDDARRTWGRRALGECAGGEEHRTRP
jgi:hypothetical protein